MPDRVISVPQAAQIATRIKNKFDNVNGRLDELGGDVSDFMDHVTVDNPVTVQFTQGSIRESDGTISDSQTRIRSLGYFTYPVTISAGDNLKYSMRFYDSNNVYLRSVSWTTGTNFINVSENEKLRFVLAFADDSPITPESSFDFSVTGYAYTDTSLEISNKSADAKTTGDKIRDIAGRLNYTESIVWESGNISASAGENTANQSFIRTRDKIEANSRIINFDASTNILYACRYYDGSGAFVRSDSALKTTPTILNDVIAEYPTIKYFRMVIRYSDTRFITDDEIPSVSANCTVKYTFAVKSFLEDIHTTIEPALANNQAVSDKNDLLGNVSIKAAKTINFADGTAPKIEWYLLHDTQGRFYRSKDLITKMYLFTFVPPSGTVATWSAGITGTNNIIFVANASGFSTSAGRLNDENRVNPVCYLASESYSVMHTVDFGSDLKPCGWLENVGYTVLPNGNLIFCEYTRGTVKTANVWLVSGTITNPANWRTTWSHDIIDALDTYTSGIKHCHEMQYDFYTGVLYFGTGDSDSGSYNYYSLDNGETWTLLYGPNKNRCRRLTFVFTQDKVYWASDSYEAQYHHFFVAERDTNGVVDVENATEIQLDSTNQQACYGCVYLQALNVVVMMDRIDGTGSDVLNWYCYDIDSGTIKKIGDIKSVNNIATAHLGFRCNFVDWYPTGNNIIVGFNPSSDPSNPDTNVNALCGNQGGTNGDGSNRINNLDLHIYKNSGELSFRASTKWV